MSSVAQIVFGLPLDGPFDYAVPSPLQPTIKPGQRVKVPFGQRMMIGFVVGIKDKSAFKSLKSIIDILDEGTPSLSPQMLEILRQASESCGCSWGEAIEAYFPKALKGYKPVKISGNPAPAAKVGVAARQVLIHDLTRAGYQENLFPIIKETLTRKQSVLVLVPEVYYLRKLCEDLSGAGINELHVLDKKAGSSQELEEWIRIKEKEFTLVAGTRSAVFAPVGNLGLIVIIDEENEAYQQEQSPHYDARRVARIRQALEQCDVFYVSRIPSAELWHEAHSQKWAIETIQEKSSNRAQVIDMTNYTAGKGSIISPPLRNVIEASLKERKTVLVFLNQRSTTKTFKNKQGVMVDRVSMGVERLSKDLEKYYPQARIAVVHKDTPAFPENTDIVIATQAILKYQRVLAFDTVAFLNFDAQLMHFEFRTQERAFALLVYLRLMARQRFLVQTQVQDDHALKAIQKMNFNQFYRNELKFRREIGLPPFKHLVALRLRGESEQAVNAQSKDLFDKLKSEKPPAFEVSDPYVDMNQRFQGRVCFAINVKGKSDVALVKFCKKVLKGFKRKSKIIITMHVDS